MVNEIAQKQIDFITERCKEIKPLVAIRCITYNHESYLRDALEGFVMQKTDYPFVAIVHDDASTDKTAEIIREYTEKYPDIIFPIYEQENQYSKRNGTLREIMNVASDATGAKYIALCEGDDYWIDHLKLEKQVSFLESHPGYSMCATNVIYEYQDGTKLESIYNTNRNRDANMEEIIINGGVFFSTASLICRYSTYKEMPSEMKELYVGDYPLQIFMTYKGNVRIFQDITTIYRKNSHGSWSDILSQIRLNFEKKLIEINKQFFLMDTMNKITEYKYEPFFKKRKNYVSFIHFLPFSPINQLKIILNDPIGIYKRYGFKLMIFSLLPKFIKNKYYKNKKKYL